MGTMRRARAILKIKRNITKSVTGRANAMCVGVGGSSSLFATPNPPLSTILGQIVIVEKAEILAGTRAKGTASARNVQRGILVGMLQAECTYVQGIADTSPNVDQAVSTIQAAGLTVALIPVRLKAILTVTQGPEAGSVVLQANATALGASGSKKTFFNWQSTADGKTFTSMPSTPKASTSLANLTPLTSYGFRVSVTNSDGIAGPWSQVVTFLVH
jgi:hypothetical protein